MSVTYHAGWARSLCFKFCSPVLRRCCCVRGFHVGSSCWWDSTCAKLRAHSSYCEWLLCTRVAVIKGKGLGPGAQRPLWRTTSFFFHIASAKCKAIPTLHAVNALSLYWNVIWSAWFDLFWSIQIDLTRRGQKRQWKNTSVYTASAGALDWDSLGLPFYANFRSYDHSTHTS